MKCCHCGRELNEFTAKLISCDGDFVCDDKCHLGFRKEVDAVCSMSSSQFENWIFGDGAADLRRER